MSLEINYIQQSLTDKFQDKAFNFHTESDMLTFEIESDYNNQIIRFLKEEESLNFHFLTDLCAIHYPDNDDAHQFAVVYHMHNWVENVRIRIKAYLADGQSIPTVINLFKTANWMERETWDFYGIKFEGHPQLKRILNMDEMVSHPMRKEFPLEDNGRTDKDDRFFGRTVANNPIV
jgi:NADH-quinone oxidoreductase subunit C